MHERVQALNHNSLPLELKKDPGVPNSWPLKEEFLQKMENQKAKLEMEKQKQKEARRKELKKRRSLTSLAEDASKRSRVFVENPISNTIRTLKERRNNLKSPTPPQCTTSKACGI